MRITIFNWRDMRHPQAGGAELYLHEQARLWVKQGHLVTWITARFPGAARKEMLDGIDVRRAGGKFTVYLGAAAVYLGLARRPDVVIDAENGVPFFTPVFSRAPVVLLIFHIHRDVWAREMPWPLSTIGRLLESRIMPFVYRKCQVVTISESSRKAVRDVMPRNPVDVVHCGVEAPYRPGEKAATPEIVFVGRLKRYKSVDILLKALALLKNPAITTHIIGEGDDAGRLKDLARELGLSGVRFLGHVSDEEKIRILQRAWVAVNPSMVEGWSITNIEANACGTPVIGSDVEGIRDSIVNGETGLLFPYADAEALAGLIRQVLDDGPLRQRLTAKGLAHAAGFAWDRSAARFLDVLQSVRHGAGRR